VTGGVALLRPALEAAIVVARDGEAADPVEPAPSALKPYLRFARLPTPALEMALRVVDRDAAFRARVVAATTEDVVGRAGWLWLTRPDGWEAELERLRRQAQERELAARDARTEHDARRRLTRAEDAARRAEANLATLTREVETARIEAEEAVEARRRAEGELAELRSRGAILREERNHAVRAMKDLEAELAQRTADLRHARQQLRLAEQALAEQLAGQAVPDVAVPASAPPAAGRAETAGAEVVAMPFDPEALSDRIEAASEAARALATSLADAARVVAGASETPAGEVPVGTGVTAGNRPPAGPARTPARLPPAVLDDSPQAVDHLVRLPGAVVLVDGYNASQTAWPERPIAEQRTRLVDALAELHARTGVDVDVVFDGASEGAGASMAPRSSVRVRFSPAGVDADDVVLALVDEYPLARPVVVASSDRRVRNGARSRGANVVSSSQLIAALRR
jgi:predicted RNA-binding protein with PIN domain